MKKEIKIDPSKAIKTLPRMVKESFPKEEPKQETLEEAFREFKLKFPILNNYNLHHLLQVARFGAKWKQERMYSEEELIDAFNEGQALNVRGKLIQGKDWFEKFKNK